MVLVQVNYVGTHAVNHKFTRAQGKLTRAHALLGPGVDMPLASYNVSSVVLMCSVC